MPGPKNPPPPPAKKPSPDDTQEIAAEDLDLDLEPLEPATRPAPAASGPPPPPAPAGPKLAKPPLMPPRPKKVTEVRSPPPPFKLPAPAQASPPPVPPQIDGELDISARDDDLSSPKPRFSPDEVIATLEAELSYAGDDRQRRAKLHWEIGLLEEEQRRQPRQARARYRQSLEADAAFLPALRSLRLLEARTGNTSEAIKLLEQEISLTRDDLERAAGLVELGRMLELRGETERAVAAYRRALEVEPGNREAIESLISLYLSGEQWVSLSEILLRAAATTEDLVRRALMTWQAAIVREVKLDQPGPAEALLATAIRQCPRSDAPGPRPLRDDMGQTTEEIEITIDDPDGPDASGPRLSAGEPLGVLGPVAAELARIYRGRGRWQELAQLQRDEAEHADTEEIRAHYLYRAGRLFADRARDPAAAEDCFEKAAHLRPDDVLSLLALAELRQRRGDAGALERTFCQLLPRLRTRENQVATRFEIARLRHERLSRTEAAIEALRQALEQDPQHIPSLRALEDILVELGRFDELVGVARAEVDRLLEPGARADAYYELGQLVERHLGDPDQAAYFYRTVLDLVPDHATALEALDRLYTEGGRWEPLVDLLETAAGATPDQRRAATRLVRAAQLAEHRLEDPIRAIGLVHKLLALRPEDLEALGMLGRLLERTGRWEERIEVLRKEVTLAGHDPERLALLMSIGAICEVRLGAPRRARDVYREVVARDPSHRAALRALARLDRRAGHFESLLATLELELGAGPSGREAAVVHYRKGRLQEDRLGMPEEALASYRAALAEAPGFRPAVDGMARLLGQLERWTELAELLETQARSGDEPLGRAVDWFQVGELREARLDDEEAALRAYHEALKLVPTFDPARHGVLRILEGQGRWDQVAELLAGEAARTQGRQQLVSLVRLAILRAWRLGDAKAAIEALGQAAALAPWDLAIQDALVQVSRGEQQWEKLGEAYFALARLLRDPRDASALLHRAAMDTKRFPTVGDEITFYRSVLELIPHDSTALTELEAIALRSGDEQLLFEVTSRLLSVRGDESTRVPLLVRQGNLKAAMGDETGASRAFKRALDLDPACLPALRGLMALATASERYDLLAELKEQEALSLRDPASRTRSMMEAGELRLGTLKQTDRAARCFSAVLEVAPGHHKAFQRLTGILEAAGRWGELAETLRLRLSTGPGRDEEINLRLRLCRIERDKLRAPETALHTLDGLLALEPDNRNALEIQGEILTELERWREAAETFGRAVEAATERDEAKAALRCRLALAELQLRRLGEFDQAVDALCEALKTAPHDVAALRLLVEAEGRRGDASAEAAALERLTEVLPPGQRSPSLLELSALMTERLDDWNGGAEALERAVVDVPDDPEPLRRLTEHYGRAGDWEGLARSLASVVDGVGGEATDTARIRVELATTLIERLGRVAPGVEHLEAILRLEPGHAGARFAMARRHLRPPGRPDLAEGQYRAVLAEDPWSVEALRGLFRLLASGREPARARPAAQLLAYLGDQEALSVAQSSGGPWRRPLGSDGYHHWVALPAEPVQVCEIFRTVQTSLAKVFPPDLERHGASREDRKLSPEPLASAVEEVARFLGVEAWETYVSQRSRHVCAIEPGDPIKLVIGVGFQGYPLARRRFEIGRVLGSVIGGSLLFSKVPRREVPVLFSAVIGSVVKGYAELGDPLEVSELTRRVSRALPRKIRKQIEENVRAVAAEEPPDLEAWMAAAPYAADRCGLLAASDIGAALNAVRSRDEARLPEPRERPEQRLRALRGFPPAEELARFWLSPSCDEALAQLGSLPNG